ncbi:hypothetical protein PR001_g31470, partial [Phytophthora rubi]
MTSSSSSSSSGIAGVEA